MTQARSTHARRRLEAALDGLASPGAEAELLHRMRLLGITGPDRWDDPHWPDRGY